MTAIAGVVGWPGDRSLSEICRQSVAAQALYGRRGIQLRESGRACFGIDLFETLPEDDFDRQPLLHERFLLVADVRLDNRDELIAATGIAGRDRKSLSDSEIVVRAWDRWQENCVERLEGDYAISVFDRASGQLTLVRDPCGNRPLCYGEVAGSLVFASMPSGITCHLGIQHDCQTLSAILLELQPTPDATCFAGVRSVMPGEILRVTEGRRQSSRRRFSVPEPSRVSESQLIEQFRDRLDEAVACRMRRRSDPIAAQLSSGYDSSSVTATAARLGGPEHILAVTAAPLASLPMLVPKGRIADESEIAARTAAFLGIEHAIVRDDRTMFDWFPGHARYFQQPVANPVNHGWWLATLRQAANRGAQVMLTGEAGNVTISFGGIKVLPHWIRTRKPLRWWRETRAAVAANDIRWRGALMASFRPFLPQPAVDAIERGFQGIPKVSDRRFVRPEWEPARAESAWQPTGDAYLDRASILNALDPGILRKGLLGRCKVDERDPTGDRRLIQFALSLPPEHLLGGGQFRPLARKALADRLPAAVLDARTRGYQGADWFGRFDTRRAMELVEDIEGSPAARALLDTDRMRAALSSWPAFDASAALGLYALARDLADSLAAGSFIVETERNPQSIGR